MPYLSTGSTILNLALSGKADGGIKDGKMFNLIGDSSAGKTLLAYTCLAEAANNPEFNGYSLYYDDVECADEFDIERLFGRKLSSRLIPPYPNQNESETIEGFYFNLNRLLKNNSPLIYVLDSMDALTSISSREKFDENAAAFEKGNKTKGSYGDGKAKENSQQLRNIGQTLDETHSILIILSQTRDDIANPMASKTRAGGRALKFYASYEAWLKPGKRDTKKVNGIDRVIGGNTICDITKNKATGVRGKVEFPIHYTFGVNDADSMISYLLAEKRWKLEGSWITPVGIADKKFHRGDLCSLIYKDHFKATQKICEEVWMDVQRQLMEDQALINLKYGDKA